MDTLLKLYPLPAQEIPLAGAYLAHHLRQRAPEAAKPFLYVNFVSSIDGRIAIPRPDGSGLMVPRAIANARDWRLYQELAVQADLIIISGRYLRDWAAGRAQEILQLADPRFADLREWRLKNGLAPQVDIAILSSSLDFSIPPVLTGSGRKVIVVTAGEPAAARIREIEGQAGQVIIAGEKTVHGAVMVQRLSELGYRTIYSAAGPKILHLLIQEGVLDRLYLTYANRLLGGEPYSSALEGPLLTPPANFKIHQIYLDAAALDGLGQLFVSYDRA